MTAKTNVKVLLKDIIDACTFGKVKKSLLALYPDQKRNIGAYRDVFEVLQGMRYQRSKDVMIIHIGKVGRGRNAYFPVSGIRPNEDKKQLYALEYTAWSKWLGYELDISVLKKLSYEDIAAHCIWEMTFAGFTQKRIRGKLSSLRKQIQAVEEGRVRTIPHEEVKAFFEDKFNGK